MTNYRFELQKLIASFDEHLGVHNNSLLRAVEEARASLDEPVNPTESEVADLVDWLCDEADQYDCIQQAPDTSHKLRRAAEFIGELNNSRSKS